MDSAETESLLSLISHELRSPLGVVRGYLRLLEQQGADLPPLHRQSVASALKASHRLAELVGQVSALAALHRQDTTPDFKKVALASVLTPAADAVVMPSDRVIHLERAPVPAVEVKADKSLLIPALTSLITAVIRAQPNDTTVRFSAEVQRVNHRDGVSVEIVAPQANAAEMVESALDIGRGGFGLELPMAAAMIDAHHGSVRERRIGSRTVGMAVWLPG